MTEIGSTWIATESPGSPVCYSGPAMVDDDLKLNIYQSVQGEVVGVIISCGVEIVGAVGLVPAEELMQK